MKDIEKIKSEDLAAQVQDANPANFAIEQEVAAMVGATVPQPTEPSADDARELGAQLLVFLRRALTPIQTALRTAVAAIYAHLDSRCTDYTPAAYAPYQPLPSYDPMGTLPARSVANLLTALTAFDSRKISNGSAPSDGIPDGISLAHLLCDTSAANAVTEICDDNTGWTFNKTLPVIFAYEKITLRCKEISFSPSGYSSMINSIASLTTLEFPELVTADFGSLGSLYQSCANITKISFPELVNVSTCNEPPLKSATIEEIDMPKLDYIKRYNIGCITGWSAIKKLRVHHPNFDRVYPNVGDLQNMPNLIHLEFGADMAKNIYLPYWNPTNALSSSASDLVADPTAHPTWKNLDQFLQNFRDHIALRLTANGSGKTLTLSQAVFDTIWNGDGTPKSTDPDSVIYQINKIIKTDKHWSVNRA